MPNILADARFIATGALAVAIGVTVALVAAPHLSTLTEAHASTSPSTPNPTAVADLTDATLAHFNTVWVNNQGMGVKGVVNLAEPVRGLGSRTVWLIDTASFQPPKDTPAGKVAAVASAWTVDCTVHSVEYAGKAVAFAPDTKHVSEARDVSADAALHVVPLEALQATRRVLCGGSPGEGFGA